MLTSGNAIAMHMPSPSIALKNGIYTRTWKRPQHFALLVPYVNPRNCLRTK
jgi:hypothetical protein